MRHINIPIFIPHLGCPNMCVFCNQRTISGVSEFSLDTVREEIEAVLSTKGEDTECEIAFFGGSFTGIDRSLMTELLEIGYEYVRDGRVKSQRCSTRPDYIDTGILATLKKYGVKTIELGLQSVDDAVLSKTKRGHTKEDAERACKLIVESGFKLIGQMMIGLPCSTRESEKQTAQFIINSGAVGARIYPTVVFRDTELCRMAESGEYTPLSIDEAVERSASVMTEFIKAGVDVIRVGLAESENLHSDKTYFAGPNHSALGELVENKIYLEKIREKILKTGNLGPEIKISVPLGHTSKAVGQNKRNKSALIKEFNLSKIAVTESRVLSDYEIDIENI